MRKRNSRSRSSKVFSMNKTLAAAFILSFLALSSLLSYAGDACGLSCPKCKQEFVCQLKVEETKESHHCWDIETKTICIPPVTFPWQKKCNDDGCTTDGCTAGSCTAGDGCTDSCCKKSHSCFSKLFAWMSHDSCGKTRCVKSLKKRTYECPACKYTWEPIAVPPACCE